MLPIITTAPPFALFPQSPRLLLNCDYPLGMSVAPPADGTPLSNWANLASANMSCAQATGGNQPLYKSNVINGRGGILFDGSNDFMTLTTSSGSAANALISPFAPFTLLFGFRCLNTGVVGNLLSTRAAPTDKITIGNDGTGILYCHQNSTPAFSSTAFSNTTKPNVLTMTCTGASSIQEYINNVASVGTTGAVHSSTGNGVSLGSATSGVNPWNGYMTDVMLYTRVLTTAELLTAYNYILNQRGN